MKEKYRSGAKSLKRGNSSAKNAGLFSVVVISFLTSMLAVLKFSYCSIHNFASAVANYCYSDIPFYYDAHNLVAHQWTYLSASQSVEYPALLGIVIYLTSLITPRFSVPGAIYFDINMVVLVILFISAGVLVKKIRPSSFKYFVFAPAVLASLFINWDLWAVVPTLLAIYFFEGQKYSRSGIALGAAIAAKFYPIVLVIPIVVIFLRSRKFKELRAFLASTLFIWSAINVPIMITSFGAWLRFYKYSFSRGIGYGSIYEALQILGVQVTKLNLVYSVATLLMFAFITVYLFKKKSIESLATEAFLPVFAFTIFSKVYSPQYVLWTTSLACFAITSKKHRYLFFLWQFFELLYHWGIWRWLLWTGQQGHHVIGLASEPYAVISLLRIATMCLFFISIISPLRGKGTA